MEIRHKVRLKIYDQPISLRCPSPEDMYALARVVEGKMEEFALQNDKISVTQLAILAALTFAQDSQEYRVRSTELDRRVSILEQKLRASEEQHAGQPRH
ncbi:MAG TPA: cell division protein ZapA [Bacillota bacterium]|nr:cell division protein ZapA [Bacillota bacterium]